MVLVLYILLILLCIITFAAWGGSEQTSDSENQCVPKP
eukprot:UN10315